jgi:hypothetical protein
VPSQGEGRQTSASRYMDMNYHNRKSSAKIFDNNDRLFDKNDRLKGKLRWDGLDTPSAGLSMEKLNEYGRRQAYLRRCAEATDANTQLAQSIVVVNEDGTWRLLSCAEWIGQTTQPERASLNVRISQYKQMASHLDTIIARRTASTRVVTLEADAKNITLRADHDAALDKNDAAMAKFMIEQEEYDALVAEAAARVGAAAAPIGQQGGRRLRAAPAPAVVIDAALEGEAAIDDDAAEGGEQPADRVIDRAGALLRAPVRPSPIPMGTVAWLVAQLELNDQLSKAKCDSLLAAANASVAETRAKSPFGIYLTLEQMLEDVYRKTIVVFNTLLMDTWSETTIRTIKSYIKASSLDVVATFLAMYALWETKTERLDLYKAGEDMDRRSLMTDFVGREYSIDSTLGLHAELDALCSSVKWTGHAEQAHRLLRCLKITTESRVIFNHYYRLPAKDFTEDVYLECIAALRQIDARFGHPLERQGETITIVKPSLGQLHKRADARAAGPSGNGAAYPPPREHDTEWLKSSVCHRCGKSGHMIKDCRQQSSSPRSSTPHGPRSAVKTS